MQSGELEPSMQTITNSEVPSLQVQQKSLTVSVPSLKLQRNLHGQTAASLSPHGHSLGLVSYEDVFFCWPQRGWDNQGHSQLWKLFLWDLHPTSDQQPQKFGHFVAYSLERVSTLFMAHSRKSSQKGTEMKPSEIHTLNQDHLGQEDINSCLFQPFFLQCHEYQLHVNFKWLVLVEHMIP